MAGLARFYERYGSWERLRGPENYQNWSDLIAESIEDSADPEDKARRQRIAREGYERAIDREPAGRFTTNDWYYSSEYSPARPFLQLLDADQNVVVNTPRAIDPELVTLNPIVVDGKRKGAAESGT